MFNAFTADVATALSTAIFKDGQQTVTANIPFGGFKLTGVAAGSANGDATIWQQVIGPYCQNASLTLSVAANALTIALKGTDGNDPSATNPVYVPFRNVTAATGTPALLTVAAATSLVISSGSTLGAINSTAFRLWIVAFNDGGTFRLGAINCVAAASTQPTLYPLAGWHIASSTAEGGAGAADSAQVFYTGTAVTNVAYTVLGYATWESGLATVGTWSATPTRIHLFGPGVRLPGERIQLERTDTGAVATGTTTVPLDDTPPTATEGDQYMTETFTPSSAANLMRARVLAYLSLNTDGDGLAYTLFNGTTSLKTGVFVYVGTSGVPREAILDYLSLTAGTSAITFNFRAGKTAGAGTVGFNGTGAGTRYFGGNMNSFIEVEEIMA